MTDVKNGSGLSLVPEHIPLRNVASVCRPTASPAAPAHHYQYGQNQGHEHHHQEFHLASRLLEPAPDLGARSCPPLNKGARMASK